MRALPVFLVAAAVLAGCGGDDGGDDGGGSGLADALEDVAAADETRGEIAWSDMAGIREAGDFEVGEFTGEGFDHWLRAYGMGLGQFFAATVSLQEATGFDVTAADQAVTLGSPPGQPTRLTGDELDVDALTEWLTDEGADEDGDLFRLADDEDTDPGGPQIDLGLLNQLNVVHVSDGVVVAASNAAAVEAATEAGDESLADDPDVSAAVACLDDVLAAYLVAEDERFVAVGIVDESTEVLCLVGDDEDELGGRVEEVLDPDRVVPSTGEPLESFFEAAEVTTGTEDDRAWARGVVAQREERPLGVLWEMLIRRDL